MSDLLALLEVKKFKRNRLIFLPAVTNLALTIVIFAITLGLTLGW